MRPLILMSGLAQGGAEKVTVEFLRSMAERGSAIPLCTLSSRRDGPLAEEISRVEIPRYDLKADRLLDPIALGKLVRLLGRGSFDLVHAHGQDAAIMASWARRFRKTRLAVTRHVMEEPSRTRRERGRTRLSLRAILEADAAVAVSNAAAARLRTLVPQPLSHLRVIPNGIQLDRFESRHLQRCRPDLRRNLGAADSEALILFPAVLRAGKGHDVLLGEVPRVLEAFPNARFIMAGDGELRADLECMAAPMGSAIRFIGNRTDMPELMGAADLVVLPSLSEALPTVAMEASAAGRAVVASRVGGVPEVVTDGVTGVLVPPGDPKALAEAILGLLADSSLRGDLGTAGHRRALKEFGMDRQVERTIQLWEEIMKAERGSE